MQITVNETGARTLAETRPMQIDGQNVYVTIGENTASLMVGGRIVAEKPATEIANATDAQGWAVEYRVQAEAPVAEEPVAELDAEEVLVLGRMKAKAEALIATAVELEAHGWVPQKKINAYGRKITRSITDGCHPMNVAASHRKDAALLMAWTMEDEKGYSRHVDNGISATDGYYAPIDRASWKAIFGA